MKKNMQKVSDLKVVKSEKSLEQMIADKKQADIQGFLEAVNLASKKFNCGLAASLNITEGQPNKFSINAVNLI